MPTTLVHLGPRTKLRKLVSLMPRTKLEVHLMLTTLLGLVVKPKPLTL
jgi:hypothetical protein